ncbi:unnamed protein product [Effrenium voratum]|nr:unnamed protein product [Effrenium voratum]
MPEILLRPHEEAYIKAHREELKRFSGMDLVFEARMRFMEMPVADREKLAPHWMEEDQPLWQPGSIPLSAVIDEEPEAQPSVRLIEPLPPLQLVAPEPEPAQPAEEPAPEPSSAQGSPRSLCLAPRRRSLPNWMFAASWSALLRKVALEENLDLTKGEAQGRPEKAGAAHAFAARNPERTCPILPICYRLPVLI